MLRRIQALWRSALGRAAAALAGAAVLVYLVQQSGPAAVWAAVTRAPALFPAILILEALVNGCEVWALALLYGSDRTKVPPRELLRSGLICYAVMCVAPMGRAFAEATRAALLSRYVGGPRAAAAAARMQGMTLLGNAAISIPCAAAAFWLLGPMWLSGATLFNAALTGLLGWGILFAGRRVGLGARLARRFAGAQAWGAALDTHLQSEVTLPPGPLAWVTLARVLQTLQRAVLLAAVGGGFGLVRGLCAQALNLVNAMVGDIIPGQLGLAEASYTLSASLLSISRGDGVAIALLAHLAQLFWLGVGIGVPLVWAAPKR